MDKFAEKGSVINRNFVATHISKIVKNYGIKRYGDGIRCDFIFASSTYACIFLCFNPNCFCIENMDYFEESTFKQLKNKLANAYVRIYGI